MQYEKQIEDYICDHQDSFIKRLKSIFDDGNLSDLVFVGRQIELGKDHRIDLLYKYYYVEKPEKGPELRTPHYIVVELKNSPLGARDAAQLARYMSIIDKKLDMVHRYGANTTDGLLVGPSITDELSCLTMIEDTNRIQIMTFEAELDFTPSYGSSWKEKYIKNIELDDRLVKAAQKDEEKHE